MRSREFVAVLLYLPVCAPVKPRVYAFISLHFEHGVLHVLSSGCRLHSNHPQVVQGIRGPGIGTRGDAQLGLNTFAQQRNSTRMSLPRVV